MEPLPLHISPPPRHLALEVRDLLTLLPHGRAVQKGGAGGHKVGRWAHPEGLCLPSGEQRSGPSWTGQGDFRGRAIPRGSCGDSTPNPRDLHSKRALLLKAPKASPQELGPASGRCHRVSWL